MELVREWLEDALKLERPPIFGCVRRSTWDWESNEDTPYRMWRGNALLSAVGTKRRITTPVGPFECFTRANFLLAYRAGQWNDYWKEDMFLEHDLLYLFSDIEPATTIVVFHENQGSLEIRQVPYPATEEHGSFYKEAFDKLSADPPGRLAKNTARAYRICSHCPYKQRCDATDKAHGDTDDWGPQYPVP